MSGHRVAEQHRATSESDVSVKLDLDGIGNSRISTGVGFYDHMLTTFARHSLIDLEIATTGDIHIDGHHSIEDTAIVLGVAISRALGDKRGIRRFGEATIPLDEALAHCVVDVAGRPYAVCTGEPDSQVNTLIGGLPPLYPGAMTAHVVQSLAMNAGLCVHLRLLAGREPHHIAEAQFKALARALRQAIESDPRVTGIPSTKGAL